MNEASEWFEEEFGTAQLGDQRLTRRLVQLAKVLGEQPEASLPDASGGPASLKATYRFFDNEGVEPEKILHSHVAATYRRMVSLKRVLAVQDTTYLDWTHHPATSDLGPLTSSLQQGLLAHSMVAFSEERVPLGVLTQQVWARDAASYAELSSHKQRKIEEKESNKWLTSLAVLDAACQACPDTHFVSIGDREADIYDLFIAPRAAGVDLLVRAAMNRRVTAEERLLWAALQATPIAASTQISMPARAGRAARVANLDIHWREVSLRPPESRAKEKLPVAQVWAVWVVESAPPEDVPPIEWMLLTTVAVSHAQEALERLEWYTCRWGIETWHKVLKSGCRIEARQLATAQRLKRLLALYSVIAWRILYATMLVRTVPDLPCTAILEESEWHALYCAIHETTHLPAETPNLAMAITWIAQLGGFLNRKQDGFPGITVLWRGIQHLADLTRMYRVFRPPNSVENMGKD